MVSGTLDSTRVTAGASSGLAQSTRGRALLLALSVVPLAIAAVASLAIGSGDIPLADVWRALTRGGTDTTTLLIVDYRVPRTILAILVGLALGLAGAIMQALTRNPLAEPGLLGVNAGAFLAVVVSIAITGAADIRTFVWWSFLGAALAAGLVYLVGSRGRGGATPLRLVLTGVALTAVLSGVAYAFTLTNADIFDRIRYWQSGSLQSRTDDIVTGVLPFIVLGALVALTLPRSLNAVALGDELALALGARIASTRVLSIVAVTLLCGAATAAAGPIGFLGLMAPYAARAVVGPDQRWIIPLMLTIAPTIMLAADVLGRVIVASEMPVGVVTAFIGAPLLIALMRRRRVADL